MPPKKRQPTKKKTEEVEEMQVEMQPVKSKKQAKMDHSEEVNGDNHEDEKAATVATKKAAGRKKKATSESEPEDIEVDTKVTARKRTKKTEKSDVETASTESKQEENAAEPVKKRTKLQPKEEDKVETKKKVTKTRKKETEEEDKKSKPSKVNEKAKVEKKEAKTKKPTKDEPKKKVAAKRKPKEENEKDEDASDNTTLTSWSKIDFKCNKKNQEGNVGNLSITTWNVDGMRAWLKKGGLNIIKHASPDVLCLQETKCNVENVPHEIADIEGYEKYWCSSLKNGYAGVGLLSKVKPIEVTFGIGDEGQDEDGRCITAEYDKFFLVTVYVPNAGRKLVTLDKRLEWNEIFKNYIKKLDDKKPVIICGDLNVAHNEIDLKNPKTNQKNAGFTQEERDGMTEFLRQGFVDTYRALYPDKENCYTFWSYMSGARKKNIGWRLDYFVVSENLQSKICDNVIHDEIYGSDHCPSTLFVHF